MKEVLSQIDDLFNKHRFELNSPKNRNSLIKDIRLLLFVKLSMRNRNVVEEFDLIDTTTDKNIDLQKVDFNIKYNGDILTLEDFLTKYIG
jgi:hypothetical protein